MSRSYKKVLVAKDKNSPYGKRQAVKSVRRGENIACGGQYKKLYCSYNICDHRIFEGSCEYSREQFRKMWLGSPSLRKKYPDWKRAYRVWLKWYRTK
ncbi:MAG: hypothetical protein ACI4JF_07845 [Oscillospiraceae bacterium]